MMNIVQKKIGLLAVVVTAILFFMFGLNYLLKDKNEDEAVYVRQAKEAGVRQDWNGLLDVGKKWLAGNPKSAAAFATLGDAYRMQGRANESLDAYGQSLSLDQNQFQVWAYYGADAFNLGRFLDAAIACENSTRLNPTYDEGWFCLATAHAFAGNHTGLDVAATNIKKTNNELYNRLRAVVAQHACISQKEKLGQSWCAQ